MLQRRLVHEGYLYFPKVLSPRKVLRARRAALFLCKRAGWLVKGADVADATFDVAAWLERQARSDEERSRFLQEWVRCVREWTATPAYGAVYEDRALRALLANVVGGPVVPHPLREARGARIGLPPRCRIGHAAHQDHNYLKDPASAFTVWIPAGDCPRRLGGLAVWPRSQRRGFLRHDGSRGIPEDALRKAEWASVDYETGDVLVFGMLTVHRALPNRTKDTLRFSIDFRYCREDCIDAKLVARSDYGDLTFSQITSKNGKVVAAKR